MKNKLFIFIALSALLACNNRHNDELTGKYVNTYERDAIHYVELKADSTFVHYYKKGDAPQKEHKGIWSKSVSSKNTEIVFKTWFDYGYADIIPCNGCINIVPVKNGELMFDYDLPDEMNFKKEQ